MKIIIFCVLGYILIKNFIPAYMGANVNIFGQRINPATGKPWTQKEIDEHNKNLSPAERI